jgi:hypothetical protein
VSALIELAWKVAAPVASGAAGVAGTIWKITKSLEDRVRVLEKEVLPDLLRRAGELEKHKDDVLDEQLPKILVEAKKYFDDFKGGKYTDDVRALKALFDSVKADLEKETEDIYTELRERSKERNATRRLLTKLSERYLALEGRIEAVEEGFQKHNDAFVAHAREQREQWQEINRALGHIEGFLRAMNSRKTSQEFPAPKVPR